MVDDYRGFYISLPNILSWDDHNPLRESANQAEVLETCCFRSYRKTRVGGLALRPWSGDILNCKTQRHQNIQLNITNVYIKYMLSMLKYTYFQYMIRLINIFSNIAVPFSTAQHVCFNQSQTRRTRRKRTWTLSLRCWTPTRPGFSWPWHWRSTWMESWWILMYLQCLEELDDQNHFEPSFELTNCFHRIRCSKSCWRTVSSASKNSWISSSVQGTKTSSVMPIWRKYDSSLPRVSRRKSGRKRGKAGRTLLSHFEASESSQVFIDFWQGDVPHDDHINHHSRILATKIASTATMEWGCHRPLLIRRARRAFSFRVAGSNCHGQHVQPVCSRKVRMMLANIALATPKQILKSQPVRIWWRSTLHYFFPFFFLGGYMFFWDRLGPISNSYSCITRSWRCWKAAWRNCNWSCSGVMRCAEERQRSRGSRMGPTWDMQK